MEPEAAAAYRARQEEERAAAEAATRRQVLQVCCAAPLGSVPLLQACVWQRPGLWQSLDEGKARPVLPPGTGGACPRRSMPCAPPPSRWVLPRAWCLRPLPPARWASPTRLLTRRASGSSVPPAAARWATRWVRCASASPPWTSSRSEGRDSSAGRLCATPPTQRGCTRIRIRTLSLLSS